MGRVELANGDGVDEGAAGWVLGDAGIVDDEVDGGGLGQEGPGVGVPAVAAVHGLHGEYAELGGGRDVEALLLGAGAGGAEGEGVADALGEADLLLDGGVVAEADGEGTLRHHQQHVPLLLPPLDVLHEARRLPLRDRVVPDYLRAPQCRSPRPLLEVPIRQQSCTRLTS